MEVKEDASHSAVIFLWTAMYGTVWASIAWQIQMRTAGINKVAAQSDVTPEPRHLKSTCFWMENMGGKANVVNGVEGAA